MADGGVLAAGATPGVGESAKFAGAVVADGGPVGGAGEGDLAVVCLARQVTVSTAVASRALRSPRARGDRSAWSARSSCACVAMTTPGVQDARRPPPPRRVLPHTSRRLPIGATALRESRPDCQQPPSVLELEPRRSIRGRDDLDGHATGHSAVPLHAIPGRCQPVRLAPVTRSAGVVLPQRLIQRREAPHGPPFQVAAAAWSAVRAMRRGVAAWSSAD